MAKTMQFQHITIPARSGWHHSSHGAKKTHFTKKPKFII